VREMDKDRNKDFGSSIGLDRKATFVMRRKMQAEEESKPTQEGKRSVEMGEHYHLKCKLQAALLRFEGSKKLQADLKPERCFLSPINIMPQTLTNRTLVEEKERRNSD